MSATRETADSYCHLKHPEKYQMVYFLNLYAIVGNNDRYARGARSSSAHPSSDLRSLTRCARSRDHPSSDHPKGRHPIRPRIPYRGTIVVPPFSW